jgi:hypothetical protein
MEWEVKARGGEGNLEVLEGGEAHHPKIINIEGRNDKRSSPTSKKPVRGVNSFQPSPSGPHPEKLC